AAYLASVDAADPAAVEAAVGVALRPSTRAVDAPAALLGRIVSALDAIVPAPPGLAEAAAAAFDEALDEAVGAHVLEVETAMADAMNGSAAVSALLLDELAALGIEPVDGAFARTSSLRGGPSWDPSVPIPTGPFGGCATNAVGSYYGIGGGAAG